MVLKCLKKVLKCHTNYRTLHKTSRMCRDFLQLDLCVRAIPLYVSVALCPKQQKEQPLSPLLKHFHLKTIASSAHCHIIDGWIWVRGAETNTGVKELTHSVHLLQKHVSVCDSSEVSILSAVREEPPEGLQMHCAGARRWVVIATPPDSICSSYHQESQYFSISKHGPGNLLTQNFNGSCCTNCGPV